MGTKIAVNEYTKLEGHKQGVYALSWLESERCLLSAGGDGAVVKWDLAGIQPQVPVTGKLHAQLPEPVFCLMEGLEGVIWAGTQGGLVFKLEVGASPRMMKLGTSSVFFISRWMDGRIAVGLGSGELVFLDDAFEVVSRLKLGERSLRCCIGSEGLIGGSDGVVWRLNAMGEVLSVRTANQPSVFCLAKMDDDSFVSGGRDAQIWWHRDGAEETVKAHLYTIHALMLEPSEGRWLASGGMDKSIKIWDAQNTTLLKVVDRSKFPNFGHTHSVNALAWLGEVDGLDVSRVGRRLLASAGDDKIIRIWAVG
jgi:WD40 repeat protein